MTWLPDALLDGYQMRHLSLPVALRVTGDPDGPLTATLIRRAAPSRDRAYLYVHGWNDYFFQTHVADWANRVGYDFYALDLRRYGRNLHEGQLAGYVTDLDDYAQELDAAFAILRQHHRSITLVGHSLGGLVSALYADRRPGQLNGLVLNAPWLDMHVTELTRIVASPLIAGLAATRPTMALPVGNENDFYRRTLHVDLGGRWDYDLSLKSSERFQPRAAWLAAVIAGQGRVAQGLAIDTPVLVMMSSRSSTPKQWSEDLASEDIVLDVDKLAAASVRLGHCVTVVRIDGGVHDLALSSGPVSARAGAQAARWQRCYVEQSRDEHLYAEPGHDGRIRDGQI